DEKVHGRKHAGRAAAKKPVYPGGGGGAHRDAASAPGPDPAQKKNPRQYQRHRVRRRRDSRAPIGHAEDAVAVDDLPIEKRRLLEPRCVVQGRNDPLVPLEHLTRDLGVARLVGADQTEGSESEKEQEGAHADNHRDLQDQQTRAIAHAVCFCFQQRARAYRLIAAQENSSITNPNWKGRNAITPRITEPTALMTL